MVLLEKLQPQEHICDVKELDWKVLKVEGSGIIAKSTCGECNRDWLAKIQDDTFKALFYVEPGSGIRCNCGAVPVISYRIPLSGNSQDYDLTCLDCHTSIPRYDAKKLP